MKKLEKLRLHDVAKISEDEQKSLYGGGSVVIGPDGNQYYCPGEVNVWTSQDSVCPQCEKFHEFNEHNSLGGVDGESVTTPLGEFFFNTLPHMLGLGNHDNVSETHYSYVVYGSGN